MRLEILGCVVSSYELVQLYEHCFFLNTSFRKTLPERFLWESCKCLHYLSGIFIIRFLRPDRPYIFHCAPLASNLSRILVIGFPVGGGVQNSTFQRISTSIT